ARGGKKVANVVPVDHGAFPHRTVHDRQGSRAVALGVADSRQTALYRDDLSKIFPTPRSVSTRRFVLGV
ncbi:hypothetical protein, partial [Rhizobium brockwellii]|uniref:hypothetical protein n=1 Tax=Rhizobium brockwellii TaxID=3019932 RepID=UPI00293DDED8